MPVRSVTTRRLLHPLHALLLAFPIALFPTALVNDVAYLKTAEMQWSNFASWAIVGALVFGAPAVLWALVQALRHRASRVRGRSLTTLLLLVVMWVSGFINAFQHSRDAWSSVGTTGLVLSIVSTVCALAAGWIAYSADTLEGATKERATIGGAVR